MNSHKPHFTESEFLEDAYSRLREEYHIPVQSMEILHSAEHGICV